MIQLLRYVAGGFFMGTADLVPGVSGGTIALVLGLYERLVDSIREGSSALGALLTGRRADSLAHLRAVEWRLLIPLLAGIGLAIVGLSHVLGTQLDSNPTVMAGGFFGLVVGSILIAWRLVKEPAWLHGLIGLLVGVTMFVLLGLGENASIGNPSLWVFAGAGALAVCAMILPGISGSLILLLIGMYSAVLEAVNERDLGPVGVFIAGAIVGLALFSQLLHWALERHHDVVLAGLVGLMAGSLRVLWPWPGGVDSSVLGTPADDVGVVVVAGAVGLGLVYVISRLAPAAEDDVNASTQPV